MVIRSNSIAYRRYYAMLIYSDGSCRRNGKPDCVAGFGVAASDGHILSGYETASTSQRGELYGMIHALDYAITLRNNGYYNDISVVSDSAYVINCIREQWFARWIRNGWRTAQGTEVKNIELWGTVMNRLSQLDLDTVNFYAIKGHTKDINVTIEKFKEANFGAVPPQDILQKMIEGNDLVDALAKHGRDYGEMIQADWTDRTFGYAPTTA